MLLYKCCIYHLHQNFSLFPIVYVSVDIVDGESAGTLVALEKSSLALLLLSCTDDTLCMWMSIACASAAVSDADCDTIMLSDTGYSPLGEGNTGFLSTGDPMMEDVDANSGS